MSEDPSALLLKPGVSVRNKLFGTGITKPISTTEAGKGHLRSSETRPALQLPYMEAACQTATDLKNCSRYTRKLSGVE